MSCIYITNIDKCIRDVDIISLFENYNIGQVDRVKIIYVSNLNKSSAYVYFKQFYNNPNTNYILDKLKKNEQYYIYITPYLFWILLESSGDEETEHKKEFEKEKEEHKKQLDNMNKKIDNIYSVLNKKIEDLQNIIKRHDMDNKIINMWNSLEK